MRTRTLYVKPTTVEELTQQWGFRPPMGFGSLFIQCRADGTVNWDKASVYKKSELLKSTRPVVYKGE